MERSTPVRKSYTSTADLLTWSETPLPDPAGDGSTPAGSRSASRPHMPSGGVAKVIFGGQVTPEEAESLLNRKPCSGSKLKEMTGSGIFSAEKDLPESGNNSVNSSNKTGLRLYQQAVNSISQISFSADGSVSPKKPTSLTEVAKQRELSGTLETESDAKKKQLSDAKTRELSGHDIFGPPSQIPPRPLAARSLGLKETNDIPEPAPRHLRTSVKVSNPAGGHTNFMFTEENVVKTTKKIHNQKAAELTGNNIFKGEDAPPSAEKPLSSAKLREMSGNDIFADGKAASREHFGGVRKPPGGESSIALV
ncbi:uncharacterized protein LOC116263178 [Nymphaea colorata]|nr:uncharacterized protein LOC116263178 [Nymphaea colorata]